MNRTGQYIMLWRFSLSLKLNNGYLCDANFIHHFNEEIPTGTSSMECLLAKIIRVSVRSGIILQNKRD
jgi:hypothetical protein